MADFLATRVLDSAKSIKKAAFFATVVLGVVAPKVCSQTAADAAAQPSTSLARRLQAKALVTAATVPYCLDLAWQVPFGSRVSWLTSSAANPDPLRAPARVFLLRGTGTMFSPGFGDLCSQLRRAGIWAEDLGPVGDRWLCLHLIDEQREGRLQGAIVLIGHSRGGRHVIDAASKLQRAGIDVDLLVCLDVALPPPVPGNVRQALSVYMSQRRIYPADPLTAEDGSKTRIDNVDLSRADAPIKEQGLRHLNITANAAVQDFVVERIKHVAR